MNRLSATLILLIVIASFVRPATAQEPTPSPSNVAASGQTEKDQPKGEIDLAVEELKKRGEKLVTLCGDKCKDSKNGITGGVINGRAIELVTPTYPAIARAAHASGQVTVLVIIDKEGKVMAAQIVDGHPLLIAAALKAARDSRFTPTLFEEKPVAILGQIIYNFVAAH
jgi:TonB family protein